MPEGLRDLTARRRLLAAIALTFVVIVAVLLRFSGLDTKVFFEDETDTGMRISGHTQKELDRLADGQVHAVREFDAYQTNRDAPLAATVHSLAVDEPQHPPLFFVAERVWAKTFGSAPATLRSLSALAGVLTVPAMFWLCFELFGSLRAAVLGAALNATSPFFVTYAREAREYALWGLVTVLATAVFLRAARGPAWWWVAYAVLVTAGLYTDVLFVWVVAAHAAVLASPSLRRRRVIRAFAAAVVPAGLAFAPWALTMVRNRGAIAASGLDWASASMGPVLYLEKLVFATSTPFFDLAFLNLMWAPVAACVAVAVVASIALVAVRARDRTRATIVALVCTTAAAFFIEDAVTHSYYATAARYLVPTWIGCELAAVYALIALARARPKIAGAAIVAVVTAGAACCVLAAGAPIWWDNHDDADAPGLVVAIDATPQSLLVAEHVKQPKLLVLSHLLRGDATFLFVDEFASRMRISAPANASVLLLEPSPELLGRVQRDGCGEIEAIAAGIPNATAADRFHRMLVAQQGRNASDLWRLRSRSCVQSRRSSELQSPVAVRPTGEFP